VAKCRGGAGGSARQSVSDGSNGQVNVWGYLGDFSLPAIEEVGGRGLVVDGGTGEGGLPMKVEERRRRWRANGGPEGEGRQGGRQGTRSHDPITW
jgi:hypothetical protein